MHSPFISAYPTSIASVCECDLQTPTTSSSFYFTALAFCLWTSSLLPRYPVCQEYPHFKFVEMKVEALEVYFIIEVPATSLWIPITRLWCLLLDGASSSSCACCCCSSKDLQGPLRTVHFLRGYPYVALVHYHFCQLSLLCKQALIFKEDSLRFTLHSALYWTTKWKEPKGVTMCCIWLQGNLRISCTNVLACTSSCNPGQMQICSALKSHLLNIVLDREAGIVSVPQ